MGFILNLKGRTKQPVFKKKSNLPRIYVADRVYVPATHVSAQKVDKHYDRRMFNEKGCQRCHVFLDGERFCDLCAVCDNYKGRFKTAELVHHKDQDYFALPAGDFDDIQQNLDLDFSQFEIKDLRKIYPARDKLKFTGKLRDGTELINGSKTANQIKILSDYRKNGGRGIIMAPARTGKTLLAAEDYCYDNERTLYLVHNRPLLKQFYRTMLKFTNLREMRQKTGRKIVGIVETEKDLQEDWDLMLVNYQKFITTKGIKRIKKHLSNRFSKLNVDEVHRSGAAAYTKFLNKLNIRRKIGYTATVKRKDMLDYLVSQVIGPVVAKGKVLTTPPTIQIIRTGFKMKHEPRGRAAYTYINKAISENRARNILLLKHIFADLRENPKNSIVIPAMLRRQVFQLTSMVNRQAQFNNANRGENWPATLAMPYLAGVNTEEVLQNARNGDTRVVVAMRSMMKEGLDVPLWNLMYLQIPIANYSDTYQTTQRVCTPYEGKPPSFVKMFVDDIGLCLGCFGVTWKDMLKMKYIADNDTKSVAEQLMSSRKKSDNDETGWN